MRKLLIAVVVLRSISACDEAKPPSSVVEPTATSAPNFSMAGTWWADFFCDGPPDDVPVIFTFTQTGNSFSGTYAGMYGSANLRWTFTGAVSGNSVQGTFTDPSGCTFTFTGSGTANQVVIDLGLRSPGSCVPGCVGEVGVTFTR
jgi:hypothetical protein